MLVLVRKVQFVVGQILARLDHQAAAREMTEEKGGRRRRRVKRAKMKIRIEPRKQPAPHLPGINEPASPPRLGQWHAQLSQGVANHVCNARASLPSTAEEKLVVIQGHTSDSWSGWK